MLTTEDGPGAPSTEAEPAAAPAARRRDPAGILLALYVLLLPLTISWVGRDTMLLPKVALSLVALGPGLIALGRLAVRRDRAAWWGTAFLVVALLATILSDRPKFSLFGAYNWHNGWLLLATCVGVWALGRCAAGRQRLIGSALIAGALVNATLAWLVATVHLRDVWNQFTFIDGRPFGLLGNPVHLAAFCAGATWLVLARESEHDRPSLWLIPIGVLVGAVNLAGSRVAVIVVGLLVIGAAVLLLRRRLVLHAVLILVVAGAGVGLSLLPHVGDNPANARIAAAPTSGFAARLEIWQHGFEGTLERPVLGYGPGRTYVATTPRRSIEAARREGPDTIFRDLHNMFAEVMVGTGFLGLALFCGWLFTAGYRARGPLAGFALVAGLMFCFQPALFLVAPLAAVALGAAAAGKERRAPDLSLDGSRVLVASSITLMVLGLAAGAVMVIGDATYQNSARHVTLSPLDSWSVRWMPWTEPESRRAQLWDYQAGFPNGGTSAGARAVAAELAALRRDPKDPRVLGALGVLEQKYGTHAKAREWFRRTLAINPFSLQALRNLVVLDAQDGDRAGLRRYRRTLCAIGKDFCPTDAQIAEAEGAASASATDDVTPATAGP